jgi:hypothetical protein
MQEFVLTLVVFFVLFKVLGEYRKNKEIHIHYHGTKQDKNNPSNIKNTGKSKPNDDGEYVDYEEIKD